MATSADLAPVANAALKEARQRQLTALRKVSQRTPGIAAAGARALAARQEPRTAATPLLSGFPGPIIFAWVRCWPFEGGSTDFMARLRIRGHYTTNKAVDAEPRFDRSWEFSTFGLTGTQILDLIARTLDDDPLDFICKPHDYDPNILRLQLPSFSIRVDGVNP